MINTSNWKQNKTPAVNLEDEHMKLNLKEWPYELIGGAINPSFASFFDTLFPWSCDPVHAMWG